MPDIKLNRTKSEKQIRSFSKRISKLFGSLAGFALLALIALNPIRLSGSVHYVSFVKSKDFFTLSEAGKSAPIVVSANDYPGVVRVVKYFQSDIRQVTMIEPEVIIGNVPLVSEVVIVGTLGNSRLIDQLVREKKINIDDIKGKWENSLIEVVENPFPGVAKALVIVGSDKRGTIFGMFDISRKIGVSPWHFWADVPVIQQPNLYIIAGRYNLGEPKVKYRGLFINDEEPALGRWAVDNYGGFNHQFYEKFFELILRLKGNYVWPAMWWASFNSDDVKNPELADELGIVMGTTHHEPMMRAHAEWKAKGIGDWNYETNQQELQDFWKDGIRRMGNRESIVSLAMRGNGDMAMSESTNIALLEKIVADQRKIIANVTGKKAEDTPQLWALYKEVQNYYDSGMRVPDDVTILLSDDNWGNLRKLPDLKDSPRKGGYGIYYHFDYVGGPRNYKWMNSSPIQRVWEQMNLAYQYGVDRIWIVNIGDLKPLEFPTEFFLDYAWNPDLWNAGNLQEYTRQWAAEQFGNKFSADIADILTKYTKFNGRRKPELLSPTTYSLINYREAETVVSDYKQLEEKAESIYRQIPDNAKDAYYQLVLHPVKACANLNELYFTIGKNRLYAKQGRASTNELASTADTLFRNDAKLTYYYNKILLGGKWNRMMDQTHIGYTGWQQPPFNKMPATTRIELPEVASMGVTVEGSEQWWPNKDTTAILPEFYDTQSKSHYAEIFNRGTTPFDFVAKSNVSWLKISPDKGKIEKEQRISFSVDWKNAPKGQCRIPVTITGAGNKDATIIAVINNSSTKSIQTLKGFTEQNGYISIEAEHFSKSIDSKQIKWQVIPDIGRTLSGVTVLPSTAGSSIPGGSSPHLEYETAFVSSGAVHVMTYFSPVLNFLGKDGLKFAISFDNEAPQIINLPADLSEKTWEHAVSDNITIAVSKHRLEKPGFHMLKIWMVDPGLVLQKIVIDCGGLKPNYLGPPESYNPAFAKVFQSGK